MDEQEAYEQAEENAAEQKSRPPRGGFLQNLIPRKDYFITPIIVDINILVFLAMVMSGVSAWLPTTDQLLTWGANFRPRPYTLDQPWRMFTSMFLHIGFIHLLVNMFSLISLGRMLESFIGKWRFLLLYILTGLCGSAVSTWFHIAPAAGASGAIFGIFGVFVAIVTTNLIESTSRKKMLRSIGTTILLNAAIGLWAGVDNSAHLGGFLSGMIGGYLIYSDLRSFYMRRVKKTTGIIMAVIVLCGIIFLFWKITPDTSMEELTKEYNQELMDRFDAQHQKALNYWDKMDSTTTVDNIEKNYMIPLRSALASFDSLDPTYNKKINDQRILNMQKYVNWRLQAGIFYERSIKERRPDLRDSVKVMMDKADQTILETDIDQ